MKGYIWKMNFLFYIKIANIRAVENVETNHCMLTKKHVSMMYNRLRGREQYNISVLTLRLIAYVVEETNAEGVSKRKEISFPH